MLEIKNLSKIYTPHDDSQIPAIQNVTVSINKGEFVAFVGPSGCGKTTLLKIVAGLLEPSLGEVILDGSIVDKPERKLGMIFQNLAIFPWLSVKDNIAFGLDMNGSAEDNKSKIEYYLNITKLKQFEKTYPKNLSGGMLQRLAIARTLANGSEVLLMDEPFGSLDAQTRSHMHDFLADLHTKERTTILLVTHDIEEALFLADRVFLFTERPAQIKATFDVPFAHPREHELKFAGDFFELKREITNSFEKP